MIMIGLILRWIGNILMLIFIYAASFFRSNDKKNYLPLTNAEILPEEELLHAKNSEQKSDKKDNLSSKEIAKQVGGMLYDRENMPLIATAATLSILNTGLNLFTPYLLSETMRLLSSQEETTTIGGLTFSRATLITALMSCYGLSQIIPNFRQRVLAPVNAKNQGKLLVRINEHLISKSLQYQSDTAMSDQMVLMQKGYMLSNLGSPMLNQIAPTLIEVAIACSVLSRQYGLSMGLGLLTFISTYSYYCAVKTEKIIEVREIAVKAGNAGYEQYCNAITQYKMMRDFGKFNETMAKVNLSTNKAVETEINAIAEILKIELGQIGISQVGMFIPSLYIGLNIQSGQFSPQDFIVVTTYLHQLANLLPTFGSAVNQLFSFYPDLQLVFKELVKGHEVVDLHPNNMLYIASGMPPSIEFDNVTFTYPIRPNETEGKTILKNMSFTIPAGKKVALISKSGEGKSTIFKLLYGYYQVTSGKIKINGQDISKVSLTDLQRKLTIFEQSPELFLGTIRENIVYGSPHSSEITDAMIWEKAREANLESFLLGFKEKLDTNVGENGKQLSGGQQQRVCILRALFKGGVINLLDEVTSSLDGESATEVVQGIASASPNTTSLMITHKLSELKYIDEILVIADGQVTAQGTHEALLQSCDLYQQKWVAYSHHQTSSVNSDSENASSRSSSTSLMLATLGPTKMPDSTKEIIHHQQQEIILLPKQASEDIDPDTEFNIYSKFSK